MIHASAFAHMADHDLVGAVRSGDADAFSVLVDRYHAPLLRHLTCVVGDPELAADLVQDVFFAAFRDLNHLTKEGSFAAWLYSMARNRVRMTWRRQRLQRFVSFDWLPESVAVSSVLGQTDEGERCDEQDLLRRVLGELSFAQRVALLLHAQDGFTAPEVALILGISRATAERRISRAKQQFRDTYRAHEQEQTGER